MKTISARVSDEEYQAFQEWCQEHRTVMNEAIKSLVSELVRGRRSLTRLTKRIGICPVCGEQLFLFNRGAECFLICLNCDFAGYLGKYSLPKKVEKYQINKEV